MNVSVEMPRYKCHKEVWALKIAKIEMLRTGCAKITPDRIGYAPFEVNAEYLNKHKPTVGGYYVVYKGGYASFSPALEFEEGYTEIER